MPKLIYKFRNDESLMLAYQHGDAVAFEVLYRRYKDALYAFLYRSCGNEALIEEIAQEAWMSIIRRAEYYEAKAKFKTYLFQVARHKLIDHWRSNKSQNLLFEKVSEDGVTDDDFLNESPSLEDEISQMKNVNIISAAILTLPSSQRDAFLLREEGFTQEQIAKIVGAAQETVKSRLRYASRQLREILMNNESLALRGGEGQ